MIEADNVRDWRDHDVLDQVTVASWQVRMVCPKKQGNDTARPAQTMAAATKSAADRPAGTAS